MLLKLIKILYNIIGGNMKIKIKYNGDKYINVITSFICCLFFIAVSLGFVKLVEYIYKFKLDEKYYFVGICVLGILSVVITLTIFITDFIDHKKREKIMKNGQKMKGQLVKFNEEYINSRFYYSVEVDFNGSVKTIKNIKGTSFVRKKCRNGGYVRNDALYVDVYILDKDYYVDFSVIKQGKEF